MVKLGKLAATENMILFQQGTRATHEMQYRQGAKMLAVTQRHVEEKLRSGVVEPEKRDCTILVLFAPKKDVKLRFLCNKGGETSRPSQIRISYSVAMTVSIYWPRTPFYIHQTPTVGIG